MRVFALLLLIALVGTLASADRCSYSYCAEEELDRCQPSENRTECNSRGGLYITYRQGMLYPSKHKCCTHFGINDLAERNLYCVRNVRTREMKCSTDTSDEYTLKIRTKCTKMTCLKID